MCQKISNDYVDILDIEYIFSTYADVNIIFNGSDDATS